MKRTCLAPFVRMAALVWGLVALPLSTGCKTAPVPVSETVKDRRATPCDLVAKAQKERAAFATAGSIWMDPVVVSGCPHLSKSHYFFDSTAIDGEAAAALRALAMCYAVGPKMDHPIEIVGQADLRGNAVQNLVLSLATALRVAHFLEAQGVSRKRIHTTSVGEIDAARAVSEGDTGNRPIRVLITEPVVEEEPRSAHSL